MVRYKKVHLIYHRMKGVFNEMNLNYYYSKALITSTNLATVRKRSALTNCVAACMST